MKFIRHTQKPDEHNCAESRGDGPKNQQDWHGGVVKICRICAPKGDKEHESADAVKADEPNVNPEKYIQPKFEPPLMESKPQLIECHIFIVVQIFVSSPDRCVAQVVKELIGVNFCLHFYEKCDRRVLH